MTQLAEVIESAFLALMQEVHTCLPGRVETYVYQEQRATVKPLVKKLYVNDEIKPMPILVNVPIVFPRTKTSGMVFPINRGDGVLIHFSERALERWYSSGDDVEPGDTRKFDLSDAVAVPGLYSFADKNIASNNNDLEIHHQGQKITIKKNGSIEIGGTLLNKLVNESFMTIFNSHTHATAPSGPISPPLPVMTTANLTVKTKAQ